MHRFVGTACRRFVDPSSNLLVAAFKGLARLLSGPGAPSFARPEPPRIALELRPTERPSQTGTYVSLLSPVPRDLAIPPVSFVMSKTPRSSVQMARLALTAVLAGLRPSGPSFLRCICLINRFPELWNMWIAGFDFLGPSWACRLWATAAHSWSGSGLP